MVANFMGISFPIGSVRGIPIRVHVLLPLIVALQVILEGLRESSWKAALFAFLTYGPILFITVFVHEMGHSLAARSVGGKAEQILLWPLGGLAYCGHDAGPKGDLWVTFAGPLTHIPQALFWAVVSIFTWHAWRGSWGIHLGPYDSDYDGQAFGHELVVWAFWVNITLMAFNLLVPAYPLDGGRIFVDVMLLCGIPALTAAKVAVAVAGVITCALVALGAIWVNVAAIAIGIFIGLSAWRLWQAVEANQLHLHPLFKDSPAPDPAGAVDPTGAYQDSSYGRGQGSYAAGQGPYGPTRPAHGGQIEEVEI